MLVIKPFKPALEMFVFVCVCCLFLWVAAYWFANGFILAGWAQQFRGHDGHVAEATALQVGQKFVTENVTDSRIWCAKMCKVNHHVLPIPHLPLK